MVTIPILRWGQPYSSMDVDEVKHFLTGEPIARVGRANAGMIQRDMRKAQGARDALRRIPIADLIAMMKTAGDLYIERRVAARRWRRRHLMISPGSSPRARGCPKPSAART